jgi:type III secretion protein T
MIEFGYLSTSLVSIALSVPRVAAALLIMPILSKDDAPGLVRNSIFLSLAIAVAPFLPSSGALPKEFVVWTVIVVKEVLIGVALGFAFAGILWAISMVGNLIDTKVGATMATIIDPLAGHQTSLTGAFLARFASWLFMAAGGLMIFLEMLFNSYVVWPILSPFPDLKPAGALFFANQFGWMMTIAFLLAAPAMIFMSMVDLALGLINRYVPQLNVLPIAMAIKAWLSTFVVLLGLAVFIEFFLRALGERRSMLEAIKAVL